MLANKQQVHMQNRSQHLGLPQLQPRRKRPHGKTLLHLLLAAQPTDDRKNNVRREPHPPDAVQRALALSPQNNTQSVKQNEHEHFSAISGFGE